MKHGFISVAAGTPSIRVADCRHNAEQIFIHMREAENQGVKILALPELCMTGYTCGDLFLHRPERTYDCVISNPPYIPSDVVPTLDGSVKDYEPLRALDGGASGMDFYRYILTNYNEYLADGGSFIFEIGYDQREDITALARELGYGYCRVTKDYGGNDRVAVIRRDE